MNLPEGFEKWNPALRGAFKKGVLAHRGGMTVDACPYDDKLISLSTGCTFWENVDAAAKIK